MQWSQVKGWTTLSLLYAILNCMSVRDRFHGLNPGPHCVHYAQTNTKLGMEGVRLKDPYHFGAFLLFFQGLESNVREFRTQVWFSLLKRGVSSKKSLVRPCFC